MSGTPEPVTATSAVPVQAPAGRRRRTAAPHADPGSNVSGSDYEEEMQVRRERSTRSEPNSCHVTASSHVAGQLHKAGTAAAGAG